MPTNKIKESNDSELINIYIYIYMIENYII